MGQIEDLQAKGFGSHGGKTWVVENDIVPLKKRVLVTKMKFGEIKTKGGIIMNSAGRHAAVAVHETVHFHVAIAIAHHPFAGVVGVIAHHVDGSVGIGAR